MPAQSTSIKLPTLSGGVAKTAPTKRRPDQVEEADNVFLSLERSLEKRQGVDNLNTFSIQQPADDPDEIVFYTLRKDIDEAFIIVLNNNRLVPVDSAEDYSFLLQIFDQEGKRLNPANITTNSPVSNDLTNGSIQALYEYIGLGSSPAKEKIRFTRVRDTLLILNTEASVEFKVDAEGAELNYQAPTKFEYNNSFDDVSDPDIIEGALAGGNSSGMTGLTEALGRDRSNDLINPGNISFEVEPARFRERKANGLTGSVEDTGNCIAIEDFLQLGLGPDTERIFVNSEENADGEFQAVWGWIRTPFIRNDVIHGGDPQVRDAIRKLHGLEAPNVEWKLGRSATFQVYYDDVPSNLFGYEFLGNPRNGDGFIFEVRESAGGQPEGFYRVISTPDITLSPNKIKTTGADGIPEPFANPSVLTRLTNIDTLFMPSSQHRGNNVNGPFYQRIRTPQVGSVLNRQTLPMALAFDGNDRFILSESPFRPRLSGNNNNNPGPSFLSRTSDPYGKGGNLSGAPITAMAYWRNRLWFASGTTVVSSRAGDPYNLWINDPNILDESDPIDLDINQSDASKIQWMVPFEKSLFLGTDGTQQFSLTGSDNFISPSTASLDSTSQYGVGAKAEPLKVGENLFHTDAGRLFAYAGQTGNLNSALSLSEQVFGYFPTVVSQAVVAPAANLILFRSEDEGESGDVYVYQQRVTPQGAGQSAFYRWRFGDDIRHMHVINNTVYFVNRRKTVPDNPDSTTTKYVFEKMSLDRVNVTDVLLDRREAKTGIFDSATGLTSWFLSFRAPEVVAVHGTTQLDVTVDPGNDSTTVTAQGDYSGEPTILGIPFPMSVVLSPFILRDGNNTYIDSTVQLKDLATRHYQSGTYDVRVSRRDRTETTATFDPARTSNPFFNEEGNYIYEPHGQHQARLAGNADDISITIESTGHVPVNITNVEARVVANVGRDSAID